MRFQIEPTPPPPPSVILFLFLIFLHICTDLTHSLLRIEVNLTFLVSVPIGLINFVFLQLNGSTKPHFYSFFAQLWYFQPAFLTPLLVFLTFLFLAAMVNKNENLLPLLHTELGLVISQVQLQGTGRWKHFKRGKWGLYVNNKSIEIPQSRNHSKSLPE